MPTASAWLDEVVIAPVKSERYGRFAGIFAHASVHIRGCALHQRSREQLSLRPRRRTALAKDSAFFEAVAPEQCWPKSVKTATAGP